MALREFVEIAGDAAEIAGVALIIGGLVFASARYAFVRPRDGQSRYQRYRHDLGRSILLGLDGRWPWQRASRSCLRVRGLPG